METRVSLARAFVGVRSFRFGDPGAMAVGPDCFTEPRRHPGPGARVVGRPRRVSVLGLSLLIAIGVVALVRGVMFFVAPGAVALAGTLRNRVWVDGAVLHSRRLVGWNAPVRLDRLRVAWLSPFGRNSGRQLRLVDTTGAQVELDATNTSLTALYAVLAEHVAWDGGVANDLLEKRLAKHRLGLPFGAG
jgi:hypothetical protein